MRMDTRRGRAALGHERRQTDRQTQQECALACTRTARPLLSRVLVPLYPLGGGDAFGILFAHTSGALSQDDGVVAKAMVKHRSLAGCLAFVTLMRVS